VTKTSRRIETSRTIDSTVGYDRAGNQIQVIQPSATTAASDDLEALYSYDPLNRLSAQTKDPSNLTHTVAYSYDGEGNQTERLDKASNVAVRRVSTVYNPDGTVHSEVNKDEAAGTTLAACNYPAGAGDLTTGYDADGAPLVSRSVSGTNGCAGATTVETQTFSYAAANDRLHPDAALPENGTNYSRTQAYNYDPDGAEITDPHVRYTYDAIGRTIASTNPNRSGSAKTTLYFSQAGGDNLAEETDGTGQTMIRYLTDDNGSAIAQESYRTSTGTRAATSTWNWLLHDTAGNVATICDDSGAVLQQAAYDPYGQPKTGGAGKTTNTTYGGSSLGHQAALTVRDANGNTRAEILGDRQYDPSTRRFTTPDTYAAATADLALGTDTLTGNRYLFAASNPVGFYEDGHWPWSRTKLYDQYSKQIHKSARRMGVDPVLLAATIQLEGNNRTRLAKFPIFGRGFRTAERSRLGRETVGIGQMRPDVALSLAKTYFAEQYGSSSMSQIRNKLIEDTDFAILMAAAYLHDLETRFGLSDQEANIVYNTGEGQLNELRRTHWSGPTARSRGKAYNKVRREITRSKKYR
jgi:hypothetical protein